MQTLKNSELRYRRLFEAAQDGILILDAKTGMIEDVNPFLIKMLGYSREEFVKKKLWEVGAFRDIEASKEAFEALQENEYIRYEDLPLKAKDGHLVQVEFVSNVYLAGDEKVIQCNIRDITARKSAEDALRQSETEFHSLAESMPQIVWITRADGWNIYFNQQWVDYTGQTLEESYGYGWQKPFHPDDRPRAAEAWQTAIKNGSIYSVDCRIRRADGNYRWWLIRGVPVLDAHGAILKWFGTCTDIHEMKWSEEKLKRQFEHLTALRDIDRVIAANYDLEFSLSEILTCVTRELGVDAADILIFNSNLQTLDYGAERGFRTQAIKGIRIPMGESYAGRVALESQLIQIPNLANEPVNLFLSTYLKGEDFVCYFGLPLVSKGQVNGVLEIFHRTILEPDTEWYDFLYSLAGQAAIAIENVMLFDGLQRSNWELTLAYDATIEGWSRALDLRDKETEGPTQRVTEMTMNLARACGLSETELVNVRRGALLHDIGKMGIPDHILLKPGDLTGEEWKQMRMHPVYAYNLLTPIAYLHKALDIPYCHHEKWDGSGYPRGLKGTQIPLAARIFAVADVWDALTSARPYELAWSKEKAREHIRALSGIHFDPQVVDVFMKAAF